MAAQAWFSRGDIDVTPGTVAVLQLTVVNLGDTTDTFVLTPAGMAAAWTTINPATLTLFGGTQQVVDIEVFPPLLPSTTAGPTSLSVRIVPQSDPDEVRSAETTLNIAGSYDERGLLGLAVHTNFAQYPFLYTYTSEFSSGPADLS